MKIVLSVILTLLIVGCSNEKGSEQSKQKNVSKEKVKEVSTNIQTKQLKTQAKQKIEETNIKVKEVAKSVSSSVDVQRLFKTCSGCHGTHAEKKALGKSQIIKDWDASKIITALQGYKNGTYGGTMKGVMQGQAAKLSANDIKALADYISTL